MSVSRTSEPCQSDDYGSKLYTKSLFKTLFPDFESEQKKSAKDIWDRILSRCGTDPDLPHITRVVDYGCGEGSFLGHLQKMASGTGLSFYGLDCSAVAIEKANNEHSGSGITFVKCEPCPDQALKSLSTNGSDESSWEKTALLVMSHTWFHFDQDRLIETILDLRPAILLVDVYSTWDEVVTKIEKEKTILEHGRPPDKNGKTLWLKTEEIEGTESLCRGVWEESPNKEESKWLFQTKQSAITTSDLFGGIENISKSKIKKNPGQILKDGRTNGKFLEGEDEEIRYVRQKTVSHQSGWGAMDCHVLVSRDPWAGILNRAFFEVIKGSITESIVERNERFSKMIQLFDDPKSQKGILGSREALVILPFDPCLVFARIVPLFIGIDHGISEHPLLIEHPSRVQTHYPSANGVFQTCFARSSSVQAFATQWTSDYQLTDVDYAIEELELNVLGLNPKDTKKKKRGCWRDEQTYPSYFMLPIYFGSLPLFCLALKFPEPFDPATTSFDVFYSTLKSLHDDIHVLLTDDQIRLSIIRPWIERTCHDAAWPDSTEYRGILPKLKIMERYLFGLEKQISNSPLDYSLNSEDGTTDHTGGVLGREWKSWVLGLPSYPVKNMASARAMNKRLWGIWEEERRTAEMDAALRISHWFQEGGFFEPANDVDDDPHDHWVEGHHLDRLNRMLQNCGCRTVDELRSSTKSSKYFGGTTRRHYLFVWMVSQICQLSSIPSYCKPGDRGCDKTTISICCKDKVYQNLKAVFCKTLGNTGYGIRFSVRRMLCVLGASSSGRSPSLAKQSIKPLAFMSNPRLERFFADSDPSLLVGEFVFSLSQLKVADKLKVFQIQCKQAESGIRISVKIELGEKLGRNGGGTECDRVIRAFENLSNVAKIDPSTWYNCDSWVVSFLIKQTENAAGVIFSKPS